jgi:hypothetical protein
MTKNIKGLKNSLNIGIYQLTPMQEKRCQVKSTKKYDLKQSI